MQPVQLDLFGGFRARSGTGEVLHLPTRKAQALLAFLALPAGQAHPRDKLAALLWGDMGQKQARGNLRQVLASLRRLLGEDGPLKLEGETVALDPAGAAVDVWRFEQRADRATPGALADAAADYGGDFLAGLTLREPPFEEWLLAQRERLRERAMEVLAKLLAHRREAGELDAAVQTALQLLTLDPLQEAVHRTLMRLYVSLGRRAAALRQYQVCTAALERELRAQPEPETKALYQRILTERAAVAPPAEEPAPTPTAAPTVAAARPPGGPPPSPIGLVLPATDGPLVGREAELARLLELLDAAWAGRGQIAAILGDPGVGKSRLAAEVIGIAARRGARVLVGRCFEMEQRLPFAVWVDALRAAGVPADAGLMESLGPIWRSELARLLPELGETHPILYEGSEPLHLFEAMSRLVEELARRTPLIILFEDGHWVDEMSLRLLAYMARRLRAWPLLWIGTFREEELAGNPQHRIVGDELAREGLAVRLALGPLSKTETFALARRLLPPGTSARADEQVWRSSEGNAFMAVETARTLTDRDPRQAAEHTPLPGRVRDLVTARIERLSPRGRRLVALASAIGRQFEFPLLQHASEITEGDAAEAMEELVRRRIFQQSGDGFEFTHDRIREVAYAGLLLPQRGLLHRRVAEALEALHGSETPDVAGALAFHYRQAGVWAKAVDHLIRFAEQAARGYAHREAAEALQHALSAIAHTPASPERDRRQLGLALRRAQSLYFIGEWAESVEALVTRSGLLQMIDDPSLSGPWHAWLGHIHVRLGRQTEAREHAERAIAEAGRVHDDATSGKAYGVLSFERFWSGRPREGVELGERAAVLLERASEPWWQGMAHFYTAFNDTQLGRLARARSALARMHAIGTAIGDNRLCNYAAWTRGWTEALEGRADAAIASCQAALDLATDPVSAAYASAFVGYAHLESGDGVSAAPRLAQAVEDYRRFHFRTGEAWFSALLAEARGLQGAYDDAADLARGADALAREIGFPLAMGLARRALGRILAARGDTDGAEGLLGDALEVFAGIGAELEMGRTRLDLAEVTADRGDPGRARGHVDAARATLAILDVDRYAGRVDALAHRL